MNALKIFNIALVAFIITLMLQFFMPKQQTAQLTETGAYISVKKSNLVVPNIPIVTYHNNSSESVSFKPCEDMTLTVNSKPLDGIPEKIWEGCHSVDIAPNSSHPLSLQPLYEVFANFPGQYILSVNTPFWDRVVTFSLEEPGFFRSMLSRIIYEPIYNLFVGIITLLPNHQLGWAILIVTILIRLILLVPQHHMLQNTKRMNEINPKLQALRKEYKDNQAELGVKMMELYKKEKINPAWSCLPLLIQMPILIGLYWVVSGINDTSNFYHLYSFFKDFDPTTINMHFFWVNLSNVGGPLAIGAALILAMTQWLQAYLSFQYNPVKPGKKPVKTEESPEVAALDPEIMKKMMLYVLPWMLAMSSLFFPLGVSLYWFIGTIFVIGQQWYVNVSDKKKKEKGEIIRKEK